MNGLIHASKYTHILSSQRKCTDTILVLGDAGLGGFDVETSARTELQVKIRYASGPTYNADKAFYKYTWMLTFRLMSSL